MLLDLIGHEDNQENLLILDYLFTDHVLHSSQIYGGELKAAINAMGVENDEVVEKWIKKVEKVFEIAKIE